MKTRPLFTIIAVSLTWASQTYASLYLVQSQAFQLEVPKTWSEVSTGTNFMIQGPEKSGVRAVVFVSHTGIKGADFNAPIMEATVGTYYAGRKEYVESKGGKLLKLLPFEHQKTGKNIESFSAGVEYVIDDETSFERTRYVSCNGSIFQIKTLDFETPETKGSAFQLGRSFACGK